MEVEGRGGRGMHVFAGKAPRDDSVAAWAHVMGGVVEDVDVGLAGAGHDVRLPRVEQRLTAALDSGEVDFLIEGPPCGTFSPLHVPQLRDVQHPEGRPDMPPEWRRHTANANECWSVAARLARAIWAAGGEFVIEYPQRRYLRGRRAFWRACADAGIVPPGDLQSILDVERDTGARRIDIAQCACGGRFQKFTTLLCSPRIALRLEWLQSRRCARCDAYESHEEQAAGAFADGSSRAEAAGAYPSEMGHALAEAGLACPRGPRRDGGEERVWVAEECASEEEEGGEYEARSEPGEGCRDSDSEGEEGAAVAGIAAGPQLPRNVRRRVQAARHKPPRWSSVRNLAPASRAELLVAAIPGVPPVRSERQAPPKNGTAPRAGVGGRPAGQLHISQLFLPGTFELIEEWRLQAEQAMRDIRAGRPARPPHTLVITQAQLQPWARGVIWDCRSPDDCAEMQPSTRHTQRTGPRLLRRERLREAAAELGWTDSDLLGQVGEGGLESRSSCSRDMVLAFHHAGIVEHFEAADGAIQAEIDSGALPEGHLLPPFVPTRSLPRNVILQPRSRVLPNGDVEDYEKARVTSNSSNGEGEQGSDGRPRSVNEGVPQHERYVQLPVVRDLGRGGAIVREAGAEDGLEAEAYCFDLKAAYRFTDIQMLDWWQHVFFWCSAEGRGEWRVDPSGAFGGAYMPKRFQGVTSLGMALGRKRQREFDDEHPYPAGVQRWKRRRVREQQEGRLPAGEEQVSPTFSMVYLDDGSGWGLNDRVPIPPELAGIGLGERATVALGGRPSESNSRAAVHLRILVAVFEWLGFVVEVTKTECGTAIVNLGFRVRAEEGRIDCPLSKRRIMLRDVRALREQVEQGAPLEQRAVERLTCRLGNMTHVLPELAPHLAGGYAVAAARRVGRRRADGTAGRRARLGMVRPKAGGKVASALAEMCDVAEALLEANEGIALASEAAFPEIGAPGVLTTVTDASGEDGVGGYAFHPAMPGVTWVLADEWPPKVREALARAAVCRAERQALAGEPMCSMPLAEALVPCALAEAVAREVAVHAVIAVVDCAPAAAVLSAATSAGAQLRSLVLAARRMVSQWLGVAIPREWNVDADILSHPARVQEVRQVAEAAPWCDEIRRVHVSREWWQALETAMALPMGREAAAWREEGELEQFGGRGGSR